MSRVRGTEYSKVRMVTILQELENEMATVELSFLRIRALYGKFRLLNGARDVLFVRRRSGFNAPQLSDIEKYKKERRRINVVLRCEKIPCSRCNGAGSIYIGTESDGDYDRCPMCDGAGYFERWV